MEALCGKPGIIDIVLTRRINCAHTNSGIGR